jgi:hypothetical protein
MSIHFLADGLVIRALPGKGGNGVFATRPFARGELLALYGGIIVSSAELEKLTSEERLYTLQVEDDLHQVTPLDQVGGPDYINHSCEPNAGLYGTTALVALRAIRAEEEICFDYAMSDSHTHLDFACQCGKPHCRKFVRSDDWRRPELQRKYRRVFSPYLRRRIAAEASARRLAQTPHQRSAAAPTCDRNSDAASVDA